MRTPVAEMDPENELVSRQNRVRLDAELFRDQYLAASGLLSGKIGGPSFHPPLPPGLSKIGFRVSWTEDPDFQQRRRGMYIVTRRNLALPMLTTFDRPDANVPCTSRERSNTPLQSLTQMNDGLFVDAARALACEILSEQPELFDLKLERLFVRCLARRPSTKETALFHRLYKRVQGVYRGQPAAAETLLSGLDVPDIATAATWTVLVRTVMNLDEFITRE